MATKNLNAWSFTEADDEMKYGIDDNTVSYYEQNSSAEF